MGISALFYILLGCFVLIFISKLHVVTDLGNLKFLTFQSPFLEIFFHTVDLQYFPHTRSY
jgi:predicted membrane channel-forming protein YqfA (hemolysin III family)